MRLRVIDLETTGFSPDAGVCEIGWADVVSTSQDLAGDPTGWQLEGTFESLLTKPGAPIPPETSAIHHIVDEDVGASPEWQVAARRLIVPSVDVLVAHSAKFERQFITDELTAYLPWICTYKCGLRLWPDAPSHSNQALRYWRRPAGLDRAVANVAHRAGPDAYVTAFHVRDMLSLAPIETLLAWSSEPALQVRCHIGQWRGSAWKDVDNGFLRWVSVRDFDEDVLFTVHTEMRRRRDEWERENPVEEMAEEPF